MEEYFTPSNWKKPSKIAGVGGSIGIPLLKISTTPYWQGSKNSSWKTCLAVDETAAKLISDKLSCQRFLSEITWDSWPKPDVWIDNKQNGWNIVRDMFPTKTDPSGTLTRWRNLRACLNSERQTLGVLGDEKINNEIFRCHAQNP